MIPATLQQSVLVQLFNFLFNGRMLNREKQIKIFLLNISFHARAMRGLQHDIHICTQGEIQNPYTSYTILARSEVYKVIKMEIINKQPMMTAF